jgi:hypothetical protein
MGDRKYRQRGYQDDGRDKPPPREPGAAPAGPPKTRADRPEGPRTPNMPGFRSVVRCHRCGNLVNTVILVNTACARCGVALHCCAQCESFDPGARYECMQPITARVTPKDAFTTCQHFEARATVERETGSAKQTTSRSAFDDLFKL